jgi:NAD(P)-dependent dehydrogenase (short-subunit alcohol dehydrogenase family)
MNVSAIRLDGKVAVVIGATGGWGSGAALALVRRGATVVLNSRTPSKLEVLAERLMPEGGDVVGIAQDISTLEGATRLIESTVERFGRVDILVNSAGVTQGDISAPEDWTASNRTLEVWGGSLLDMSEESWKHVIATELTAVFTCTKAAARQMVTQGDGGAIVSIVSATVLGGAGQSAHAAAKGGLLNSVWSWSDELAPHRITVNAVRGYVRSVITDPSFDVATFDFDAPGTSSGLPCEPAEAGELIAWLVSPQAAGVTGAFLGIDGPRITVWGPPRLHDTAVFRYPRWTAEALEDTIGPIVARTPPRPTVEMAMEGVLPIDGKR